MASIGGSIAGAMIAIKLMNGKIKPKFGWKAKMAIVFLILLLIVFLGFLIYGLISLNFECIFMMGMGSVSLIYMMYISPYFQKSSNYYIEFKDENTLDGFKLLYKGKEVKIDYKIGKDGKLVFANNLKKTECVSYADGSKVEYTDKFKIVNYFTLWLHDNNLLSDEVTASFE